MAIYSSYTPNLDIPPHYFFLKQIAKLFCLAGAVLAIAGMVVALKFCGAIPLEKFNMASSSANLAFTTMTAFIGILPGLILFVLGGIIRILTQMEENTRTTAVIVGEALLWEAHREPEPPPQSQTPGTKNHQKVNLPTG
ncbi:MAG: hypothetical protein P9X24_10345 [Candidatus Hatepunaea meridiana]|nr:hypothetical protein [Candidatus Hatepunaea meridiana]